MFCTKCGSELPKGAKFCIHCGTKTIPAAPNRPIKANNFAAQNSPLAPPKPKGKLKKRRFLTVFAALALVLIIIITAVIVKKNKVAYSNWAANSSSVSSTLKANSGNNMLQPGAANLEELVDTLSTCSIFSEESIRTMSNSMLWWMWVDELNRPDILQCNAGEIRLAIKYELAGRHASYDSSENFNEVFSVMENLRVHIKDVNEISYHSIDMQTEAENEEYKRVLLTEAAAVQAAFSTSGYTELNGEKNSFTFKDNAIAIIVANDRYYWCATEIF